ncbi:hypothetical protein Tco_0324203, partial [Tanacetum coccineum]
KKGKLAPRFVGPFEITERIGPVAYRLRLPEELNGVHDTFHMSNLKKRLADPTLQIPLDEIQVDARLNFVEEPVEILEGEFKKLKRSRIAIVKVRWNSKQGPEFTWEREDQMKLKGKKEKGVFDRLLLIKGKVMGTYINLHFFLSSSSSPLLSLWELDWYAFNLWLLVFVKYVVICEEDVVDSLHVPLNGCSSEQKQFSLMWLASSSSSSSSSSTSLIL